MVRGNTLEAMLLRPKGTFCRLVLCGEQPFLMASAVLLGAKWLLRGLQGASYPEAATDNIVFTPN